MQTAHFDRVDSKHHTQFVGERSYRFDAAQAHSSRFGRDFYEWTIFGCTRPRTLEHHTFNAHRWHAHTHTRSIDLHIFSSSHSSIHPIIITLIAFGALVRLGTSSPFKLRNAMYQINFQLWIFTFMQQREHREALIKCVTLTWHSLAAWNSEK